MVLLVMVKRIGYTCAHACGSSGKIKWLCVAVVVAGSDDGYGGSH